MQKPLVHINIVSDVVCPWCYIGKRRIEQAMQDLQHEFDFEVEYLPFELNPGMPEGGESLKAYLMNKFGGEARYHQITQHVTAVAAQEGLIFDFNKQKVSPNTKAAHRIIWQAKQSGKQLAVVEAFFKAYFTAGIDLSKKENLVDVALSAGLSGDEVEEALNKDESLQAVAMAQLHNRQMGINGVPFYIINHQYAVSGAQPASVFIDAFRSITQKERPTEESCDVENKNC